jgi:hypothetical protein
MIRNLLPVLLSGLWLCLVTGDGSRLAAQDSRSLFEDAVAKILTTKCGVCHGAKKKEGELDLSSPTGVVSGGESGRVFEPGKPNDSLLLSRVLSGEMPPEGETPLTEKELQTLRRWVSDGAKFKVPPKIDRRVSQHDAFPILLLRCTACHGTRRKEGGLDLRTRESILKGGTKGPAAVVGMPAESLLIKRVHAEEMPPRRLLVTVSVKPMVASELATLERWIKAGLPLVESDVANSRREVSSDDRKFWSFQSPKLIAIPDVERKTTSPIDAFVEQNLNEHDLALASAADRMTLLRRVCIDLTGLPPTIRQQDKFLADDSKNAWSRLIDRLLDSPRYGERWARHWLDAAGYADSEGAQNEDRVRPHIWRYRDYVVRAFNSDKPYDRFLQEQIAGDELVDYENAGEITPEIYDCLVATGFLRTTPDRTFADITNFVPDRLEVVADEMQVFSSAVLGLTLQCARCHAHKFDPISQHDYYGLTAIFKDAYDEHDWLKSQGPRTLPFVTTKERSEWEANEESVREEVEALKKELAAKPDETKKKELEAKVKTAEARRRPEPRIRALWSRGEPSPSWLLRRGNYLTPGQPIPPNVPAALSASGFSFEKSMRENRAGSTDAGTAAKKTGRRLALARWLTRPDHPLTARVMVNRVWKHHFGRGLVRTLDNFGVAGEKPSHPKLLDWLATEFVKNGWSIKWLHRTILNSETWQQTSRAEGVKSTNDASLLWHMPLLRMDAEVIRDSLLSVSGQLDVTPFGPPDPVEARGDGLVTATRTDKGWRRSIFIQQRRTRIPTLLENFDFPQMGPNCVQRGESVVAPQALHLLNNKMVHELAGHFAARVHAEAGEDSEVQLRHAWRLAVGRLPSAEEEAISQELLAEFREKWVADGKVQAEEASQKALGSFCHAVMNSAAFLYID